MKTIRGTVAKGRRRGHELGYPTANIPFLDADVSGIYAACVSFEGRRDMYAAAFVDANRGILEVHILDFDGDLYEKEIVVDLVAKIRESAHFESDNELKFSIAGDIAKVREYFKN